MMQTLSRHAVLCCAGRFAADELELKPEPTLESFGIKPDAAAAAAGAAGQQEQQANGGAAAAAAAAGSDDEAGERSQSHGSMGRSLACASCTLLLTAFSVCCLS
jgi:hypothetical protein